MENWHKHFLLTASLLSFSSGFCFAAEPVQVINPEIDRRQIEPEAIDTENIEIGIHYGMVTIEDFDSAETYVVRAALHVTEDFFFELSYSEATGDETSFEQISGGLPLYTDEDREFTQYNIALGWNALPGQVHVGDSYTFNSAFYVIGGIGTTEFLNDSWFTATIGAGYRVLLTDTFAWHIDVRDHIFDRETFGIEETTNNIEFTTGISLFF